MSWLLAFAGFAVLIILHELGHFVAAKAVGMRVERFSLFFPPLLARVRRGETEYAVGAVPLGGYVKITGMNPAEEIPPEVAHRAYFRQPVWKRIIVIAAGPFVNVVIAFGIFAALAWANGVTEPPARVGSVQPGKPAEGKLRPGDAILAVDGQRVTGSTLQDQQRQIIDRIAAHHCSGTPADGCRTAEPVRLLVARGGSERTVEIRPFYDAAEKRTRLGYVPAGTHREVGAGRAAEISVDRMWFITKGTVETIAGVFDAEKREQISGVVGSYEVTRQYFEFSFSDAMIILGVISLSLGVINLFPFLPLDGGHIFWALAEKVRGRAIPFSVMERAGFVGFVLVITLFVIGFTNDIGRLTGEGFNVPR